MTHNPFPYPEPGQWPPNYTAIYQWRQRQLMAMTRDPKLVKGALEYYRTHHTEFIEHWMTTYDPRNAGRGGKMTSMPFLLFPKQRELLYCIDCCLAMETSALIEKCRDMGATWLCAAKSVCLWLFLDGSSVGWGSRKQELVDRLGDPDSIFEKMRIIIRLLPPIFWPKGFKQDDHMPFMRIVNPQTGASITGESGDNIGRGGRKLIYFVDEAAHLERPEKIEAALSETTRVRVDISSVSGPGSVFHRKRKAGVVWSKYTFPEKNKSNIFVMDWRDHPEKTYDWYEAKRKEYKEKGLSHLFAQEIDRDYSSALVGIIIQPAWVNAAIDADKRLGFDDEGRVYAGLDVGGDDPLADKHALVIRKGPCCKLAEHWNVLDSGATTRKAIRDAQPFGRVDINYDAIGIGGAVKAESNRLHDNGDMPFNIHMVPWFASGRVLHPEQRLIIGDPDTPFNKDFFANLKAQGWWQVAQRFYRTFRAVTEGIEYDPGDLISIPSDLPNLQLLQEELSQATAGTSTGSGKVVVNKQPEGTKSPNLADSFIMAYWPAPSTDMLYTMESIGI